MTPPVTAVDTLIHPGWIVPVVPHGEVLSGHSLAISGDRIVALLPRARTGDIDAARVLELPDHVLLPGLVNAHGHAAMTLLRGYADDKPLRPWLEQHIWPLEAAHVSADFVRDGAELAITEMIRCGTTTFSDMYFFPDACAEVAQRLGMRCQITFPILDFPTVWARDADEYISKGLALRDATKHRDLVTVGFGPHAPYTVSEPSLVKVATLAAELDAAVQIHLHETRAEVLLAVEQNGERPLETLHRLGLLGPRTQCVHMVDLGDRDIALLGETGAHVVHCPQSNMKLASGACPVRKLLAQGVNVAMGTDSAASNNDLNLFGEMQSAAMLAKLQAMEGRHRPARRRRPRHGHPGRRPGARSRGSHRQPRGGQAGGSGRRRPRPAGDPAGLPPAVAAGLCLQRQPGHPQLDRRGSGHGRAPAHPHRPGRPARPRPGVAGPHRRHGSAVTGEYRTTHERRPAGDRQIRGPRIRDGRDRIGGTTAQ